MLINMDHYAKECGCLDEMDLIWDMTRPRRPRLMLRGTFKFQLRP
jgi:hypothetical protein